MAATFSIALAGVLMGAIAAYVSQRSAATYAARTGPLSVSLREDPDAAEAWRRRHEIVQHVLQGADLERLPAPPLSAARRSRPKIIIIFDDMGIDPGAFEEVMALPGPVTLSFLPYAENVAELAAQADKNGREILLHMPMEPAGSADPGPHALRLDMTGADFIKTLQWNLTRFEGYVGVNNHMGSKLTTDAAAMKTVLAYLQKEGLFFLDSLTTSDSAARRAGVAIGARVFSRDVFLDPEGADRAAIKKQIALAERIALETGFAVAIGHPRRDTIEILGPWLASAPLRGFDLAPVSALIEIDEGFKEPALLAAAPPLRL